MKERPISITTGQPSQRSQRLKGIDGLTWKQRNREAVNARRRELYAADKEKHQLRASNYRKANRQKVRDFNRPWLAAYRARLRAECIAAYGGACKCCGESEHRFLQLDHIHNDGHIDRKINRTSAKLMAHLRRSGWPSDHHQLLCANCNFGKLMNNGVCPHAA